MVCLRWLLVVVMAYVCVPGFVSVCWNSSICSDLSNERKILDCIQLCMPKLQSEISELDALALRTSKDDLLLSTILANLASSEDKLSESGVKAHGDERRSYSMEHFRWGKPSGRKRRPIKVFASSLEGGGATEGGFLPLARRQLGSQEDETRGQLSQLTPGSPRARVNSKAQVPLGPQDRKGGAYRMSHFRWGNPPASKRDGSSTKQTEERRRGQLAKLFRNIILQDMQRIRE